MLWQSEKLVVPNVVVAPATAVHEMTHIYIEGLLEDKDDEGFQ